MSLPQNRSEEQIRQEYMQACAQAGELQYNITKLKAALEDTNERINSLNDEFTVIAAAKEAQPKPEVKNEQANDVPAVAV